MGKKIKLTENDIKNIVLEIINEGFLDKIKDKWFELSTIIKYLGYSLPKLPSISRLKKNGNIEEYEQQMKEMTDFLKEMWKKHPEHDFNSKLKGFKSELRKLDDMAYDLFDKDPSEFAPHQQDILLKGLKVTDKGLERDLDIYS